MSTTPEVTVTSELPPKAFIIIERPGRTPEVSAGSETAGEDALPLERGMSTAANVRANMRQAVEESALDLEAIAASTEFPFDELRDEILNGGDGSLSIRDIYRVFVAIYPGLPLTLHEWFREPEGVPAA